MLELCIEAEEVLADLRSAAWIEQELHSDLDRHRRHQMADICEPDNVGQVWRVLAVGVAELRLALLKILKPRQVFRTLNGIDRPQAWILAFSICLPSDCVAYVREKAHEFLVAKVMADRAAVIIPQCAPVWQERADAALSALRSLAAAARPPSAPVRRPLWPL